MDYVPRDMSELYNLSAYPHTTSLEISAGQLERLDLRGLKDLRRLQIKGAKDGLIVDATDCAKLREIQVTGTPNLTIRQHPRSPLQAHRQQELLLQPLQPRRRAGRPRSISRMSVCEILTSSARSARASHPLSITVEAGDVYGADGLRYRPLPFDNTFITQLSNQLPQLQRLQVTFAERQDFDRASFDKLKLPALQELSIGIRPGKTPVARSSWGHDLRLALDGCPALRQVALLHLYASQIDLSPLTSSSSPHLKQVIISGAAKALTAPSLSHPFDLTAEVEELSQIIVPSAARKKGSLSLRDYTSRDENGRAINNLPFVHTALDYDLPARSLRLDLWPCHKSSPSKYIPRADEQAIWFAFNILDFSGEQWRGFKGLVYLQGLGGVTSRNSQIDYIDFGHLTKANISASSITVNPGCVVKNAPEGLRIYYASRCQQE